MKKNIDDILREAHIPDLSDSEIQSEWKKTRARLSAKDSPTGNLRFGKTLLLTGVILIGSTLTVITLLLNTSAKKMLPAISSVNIIPNKNSSAVEVSPSASEETNTIKTLPYLLNNHSISEKINTENNNTLLSSQINTADVIAAVTVNERKNLFPIKAKSYTIHKPNMSDTQIAITRIRPVETLAFPVNEEPETDNELKHKNKIHLNQMIKPRNQWIFGVSVKYIPAKLKGNLSFWNQVGAGISIGKKIHKENYLVSGLEYSEYNIPSIAFTNESFLTYGSGSSMQYASDRTVLNRVGGIRIPLQYKINSIRKMSIRFGTYIERSLFYYGSYNYAVKDASGNVVSTGNSEESSSELRQINVRIFPNSQPFSPYRNINVRKFDAGITFSAGYTPDKNRTWEFSIEGNYGLIDFTKPTNSSYYNKYFIAIDIRKYLPYSHSDVSTKGR